MAVIAQKRRDTTFMIEVMILNYCGLNGVTIPESGGSKTGMCSAEG